jgi:hypothetical protein
LENWSRALEAIPTQPEIQDKSALSEQPEDQEVSVINWGAELAVVRDNLLAGNLELAEEKIPLLLGQSIDSPLIAVTHLEILKANPNAPLTARRSMAEFYHRQWPDCVACTILLGIWLMQEGSIERAVSLLHQAAARDLNGIIAQRLLGPDHPYQLLWPEDLSINLDLPIPSSVLSALGWNRLEAGEPLPPEPEPVPNQLEIEPEKTNQDVLDWAIPTAVAAEKIINKSDKEAQPSEDLIRFSNELDDIALKIDQIPPSQYDGRFPVYVVFSVYQNLASSYGSQTADQISGEMKFLAQAVSQNHLGNSYSRWVGTVFLPDKLESTSAFNLAKLDKTDPWTLKNALTDLDKALAKRGQMIGALLIVGGPEIVPFHNLPNPVDDPDGEVPSDNPYSTRDENYFIPEWPVGRLPGEAGSDGSLLIEALKRTRNQYASQPKNARHPLSWLSWIIGWLQPSRKTNRKGFGYTAAVWRKASIQVFRPVGEARAVMVSPPSNGNGRSPKPDTNGVLPSARLGYFNLHGLSDTAEWYGQRDPTDHEGGPDFPVAVSPKDIEALGDQTPVVVFSEACYGALINNKTAEQALALKFLQGGTQVVVGSTTMSYGAINAPLIAADLLGYSFWKGLLEGLSAGEALLRAKIHLASEMHQRQGYLDGEDQKTLISFILIGDPLTHLSDEIRSAKYLRRTAAPPPPVKTVCDKATEPDVEGEIPAEVMRYVKQVVANYLPGMNNAHLTYTAEKVECVAHDHTCPTNQLNGKSHPEQAPDRHVVVLNKTIEKAGHTHPQYARLTLDGRGKLVKVVVSR